MTANYVTKVKIYTDGGNWEYEVGGTIDDPDEFDWEIKAIEVIIPIKESLEQNVNCPSCDSKRIRIVFKEDDMKEVDFYDCTLCSYVWKPDDINGKPMATNVITEEECSHVRKTNIIDGKPCCTKCPWRKDCRWRKYDKCTKPVMKPVQCE